MGMASGGCGDRGAGTLPRELLVLCVVPLALIAAPLAALVARSASVQQWRTALADETVRSALALSFKTTLTALALIVVVGTPLAFLLSRHRFPGDRVVDALIDLPMVLPPAVAGVALLMAFGRRGTFGAWIEAAGLDLAFSTTGVVMAQCFVAAPFYIRAARTGFDAVDPELENVAGTLGEPPIGVFRRITLPLAGPALAAGAVMAWARAMGEFGATLMFAGNFPGRTQTMPLAIYTAMERDIGAALTLAVLLLGVSFAALLALRSSRSSRRGSPHAA
jgi:molybdate transport system permease protein